MQESLPSIWKWRLPVMITLHVFLDLLQLFLLLAGLFLLSGPGIIAQLLQLADQLLVRAQVIF